MAIIATEKKGKISFLSFQSNFCGDLHPNLIIYRIGVLQWNIEVNVDFIFNQLSKQSKSVDSSKNDEYS